MYADRIVDRSVLEYFSSFALRFLGWILCVHKGKTKLFSSPSSSHPSPPLVSHAVFYSHWRWKVKRSRADARQKCSNHNQWFEKLKLVIRAIFSIKFWSKTSKSVFGALLHNYTGLMIWMNKKIVNMADEYKRETSRAFCYFENHWKTLHFRAGCALIDSSCWKWSLWWDRCSGYITINPKKRFPYSSTFFSLLTQGKLFFSGWVEKNFHDEFSTSDRWFRHFPSTLLIRHDCYSPMISFSTGDAAVFCGAASVAAAGAEMKILS